MPGKKWDEEESSSSSSESGSPVVAPVAARRRFEDEEEEGDVLDSWDAAEDSEVEREKAKKAEEAKAAALAKAAANKKSKTQRMAEHIANKKAALEEESDDEEEETPAERRARLRATEKDADLAHAQDLFDDIGISNNRKGNLAGAAVVVDPKDPNATVNIADLPLFNPKTKLQFENLRNTLAPIISSNSKQAHYGLFLQEFSKQLAKEMPSDQIKKIASSLTALGNEKQKQEKAASTSGKKTKAAKTKVAAVIQRDTVDTSSYGEETFGDDDFM